MSINYYFFGLLNAGTFQVLFMGIFALKFTKLLMKKLESKFNQAARFELIIGWKSIDNIALYTKLGYGMYKIKNYDTKDKMIYMEKINIK